MPELHPVVLESLTKLKALIQRFDTLVGDVSTVDNFGTGSHEKFLEIIKRASIVRQRESFDGIISLCESGQGAFAVCLLRPAYEELLWMAYLRKHPKEAPGLATRLALVSVGKSLEAQRAHIGDAQMERLGFPKRFLNIYKTMKELNLAWLRGAGSRLGWRKNSEQPTLTHIAQEVGRKAEYDFIYEATSRFVHFSPHELCRRAWGKPEGMSISSNHFEPYWSRFAIYWALRTYIMSLVEVWDSLNLSGEAAAEEFLIAKIGELIKEFPPVPIVTKEELEWFVSGNAPTIPNWGESLP
jgi:hypothetical protein